MDFIDDHALQAFEDMGGIFVAKQKREGFRRGQKDMRWVSTLALLFGGGGVTGSIFNPDIQANFVDRSLKVAPNISGEGFQR